MMEIISWLVLPTNWKEGSAAKTRVAITRDKQIVRTLPPDTKKISVARILPF
jgi:hypothetical protein